MSGSELTYSAEHVQRLLQCAVCLDRFKTPKLLPCQHTFCLSPCLEGLVDCLTRSIRCPECRADHTLPRGGPSHFPNNRTIVSFLELPAMSATKSSAGGAAEAARPVHQNGAGAGSNRSKNPVHNACAAGIGSDRGEGAAVSGGGGCVACGSESPLARCCHCDQLLCASCKRAHMDMVRTDVNRLVSQVRRALPQVTVHINQVGRKGAQLQDRCESVKHEITQLVDKHIRELKTRERVLHDEVAAFLMAELRAMRTQQENLEVELASTASFCDCTEAALGHARDLPDDDLVEMKRQCVEYMGVLKSYSDGTYRLPHVRLVHLSADSQLMSTAVSTLGDIVITATSSNGQDLNLVPTDRPGAAGGRSTGQGASDLALSMLNPVLSQPPSLSRRRPSPPRNARSAQGTLAPDDVWYEEEQPGPTPRPRPRRHQRPPDMRVAGLMGGGGGGGGEGGRGGGNRGGRGEGNTSTSRRTRHRWGQSRRLNTPPPSDDAVDQNQSTAERNILERQPLSQRRAFLLQEEAESVDLGAPQSLALPTRQPLRASVRFDVALDTAGPEDQSDSAQITGEGLLSYVNTETSPSMHVANPRNKYNQKSQAMIRFGGRGNGESRFTWPRGVAVSPLDDNIFVSDSSNHRVQVFDNTGLYLRSFGRYGQAEGEFDCLAGITVNGLGQVIIADRYNHRVQIFDRNGTFQRSFGSEGSGDGELNYPWGVACDSMGFIYVCDKENHRLQVFQSNGAFVRKFGQHGNSAGCFDNPHYVAVSPDNKVYVSDSSNHRIQVFSMFGDWLFSFGLSGTLRGQIKFPRGIAVDSQGFVVVADSGNNRVQVFRADGRFFSMFGSWGSENGQFKGIEGLAILANGNVVVSDRENHRIQIF